MGLGSILIRHDLCLLLGGSETVRLQLMRLGHQEEGGLLLELTRVRVLVGLRNYDIFIVWRFEGDHSPCFGLKVRLLFLEASQLADLALENCRRGRTS